MNILITGGTTFASRFAAEYFVEKGHDVYVINRGSKKQSVGVHLIECDRHSLGDKLKKLYFDLVIDVTAYNKADVHDLVSALGEYKSYVFISSSAVYPETLSQPFSEKQPCGENKIWGSYGTDKLAAEEYLTENVPQAYILRPPYLYGPMNNLYREAFVFECAERNLPFYTPNKGELPLQFFHIEDLCRFIEVLIAKKPSQRIFNVGNKDAVTVNEWVRLCYGVLGKIPDLRYVTGHNQRAYFSFYDYTYRLDVSAQLALMPDTIPLSDGLVQSYEWFRDNKDLIRRKDFFEYIEKNLLQSNYENL